LLSLLFGLYKGFIRSVLALLALFLSMWTAYSYAPKVTNWISGNDTLLNTVMYYSDASLRIPDLRDAETPVSTLSADRIVSIVAQADLPEPFSILLESNMMNQTYAVLPNATVSDYLNQTIVSVIINIISFVGIFLIAYLVFSLTISLAHYVFRFPSLRKFDALLGGIFGVGSGVFFVYILFALVPIFMTVLPFPQLSQAVEESQFGRMLINSTVIQTILQGHL
jgi:uncharacterized membrane protein required for colicin V production